MVNQVGVSMLLQCHDSLCMRRISFQVFTAVVSTSAHCLTGAIKYVQGTASLQTQALRPAGLAFSNSA